MEDEDDYFDTISVNSVPGWRRFNSRDYINLSRNTVYYSTMELDGNHVEMTSYGPKTVEQEVDDAQYKVSSRSKTDIQTYHEWRKTKWNCFSTGECVDFILAYDDDPKYPERQKKRDTFESNLKNVGLILEKDDAQAMHFVKIHTPKEVLCQYAEILKLRLPTNLDVNIPRKTWFKSMVYRVLQCLRVQIDEKTFPPQKYNLTYEYSRDKDYLFDCDAPNFFKTSSRVMIIDYILEREKYDDGDHDRGIKNMLSHQIYKAAYPLHDGDIDRDGSQRKLLFYHWASISKWIKYQPIDQIKEYFGVKFALYFTWLGFYTHMLIPSSIIGILCLFYGIATLHLDTVSQDICNSDIVMCPRCDKYCDYWYLKESCTYSKVQRIIDNPATIFFSVFMSFWATLYLELWKRYSAEVTHRWGLTGFDLLAEPPRPEYLSKLTNAKKKRFNAVTHMEEPAPSYWKLKLPSIVISFALVLVWILIAAAVVFGVTIYRMSLLTSETLYSDRTSYRIYVVPITAAIINLFCIQVLNMFYDKVARFLTEMEFQRTQTEFEESLTLKSYMFQFVNYYSSIFYIAFLKGKFVGYPAKYNRVFGFRQEECNPGGCLMELTIQLAIIMIGNQALNSFLEMVIPIAVKMYKTFKISAGITRAQDSKEVIISCNQWTEDYKLNDFQQCSLFQEYLEMVVQYGFVTIFVTAFPLAPLFALINNVLEMRLDAKKFIKYFRRPVPARVKDIGVWLPIISTLGRIAVMSNAFIIAFSSNFIPKLVYSMKVNPSQTEDGYLNFSLAYFNTSDFGPGTAPESSVFNVSMCRYAEFRNPPTSPFKYKRPLIYWHILAARLAFIVVYQNLVNFLIMAVSWSIPDIPRRLNDQIKREAYQINETIIRHEARKRKNRESPVQEHVLNKVNGDIYPASPRSTLYFDADDES